MRYLLATIITVTLAGPACAQMNMNKQKSPLDLKYEREEREQKENEQAYNEQMKRMKKQGPVTTNSDPWKGVRSTSDSNVKR